MKTHTHVTWHFFFLQQCIFVALDYNHDKYNDDDEDYCYLVSKPLFGKVVEPVLKLNKKKSEAKEEKKKPIEDIEKEKKKASEHNSDDGSVCIRWWWTESRVVFKTLRF